MQTSKSLFLLASLLAIAPIVSAQPCTLCLDPSFGSGGEVTIGFDIGQTFRDAANGAVRIPGDGTIFVVGQVEMAPTGDSDFGLVALDPADGSLATSFGLDGKALLAMDFTSGGQDVARDVAWIPWNAGTEWRLVVVGEVERSAAGDFDFGVALVRPDGSFETLAGGGSTALAFDAGADFTDLALTVAVDASDRILVAGPVDGGPDDTDWGFARLQSDLSPDLSFGTNGKVIVDVSGLAVVRDLLIQPDGKILAVGTRDFSSHQLTVVRLNEDGTMDTSFGFLGFAIEGSFSSSEGYAILRLQDGAYYAVGEAEGSLLVVTYIFPDGTVGSSSSWGAPLGCDHILGRKAAFDPIGFLVIGGESFCNGSKNFFVVRGPDYRAIDFDLGGSLDDRLTDLVLQPDGKIVMTGRVERAEGNIDFGVARLSTEIVFADGFEIGSAAEWSTQVF